MTDAQLLYWASVAVTLICLMRVPTKMNPVDNLGGSLLLSLLLGPVLWPVALLAVGVLWIDRLKKSSGGRRQ